MKFFVIAGICAAFSLTAADVKIKLTDLPPAVRRSADEQVKNATLVGVNREIENGKNPF